MNIVVGRILFHVLVGCFLVWITPFYVLTGCQRQRRIQHGVQHVNEWDLRHHSFEQIGAHVRDGAHQHPTGAAALDNQPILRRVFVVHKVFAASNKVGEGIHLIHHATGIAPGLAQFTAAADVRDDVNHTSIEQSQTAG